MEKGKADIAPRLLGVTEAAAYLSMSITSVWRLMKKGKLPTVNLGGRKLIDRPALDVMLNNMVVYPDEFPDEIDTENRKEVIRL